MSEKASRNEGADEANDPAKDLPGIPVGEELALGPVEGEEIDPLPKWWDEPLPTDKNKAGNRRLEDGIDFETPRRKKPMPRFEEGDLDLPAMETGTKPREELPEMPVSGAGGKKTGFDGIPDDAKIEVPAEVKLAAEEGRSLPEIEFDLKPLKRHRHEGEEGQEADLAEFFSDSVLEEQPKAEMPVKSSSEDALPEMVIVDLDLPDLPKKSAAAAAPTPPPIPVSEPIDEPVIEPAVVAEAPRKAGPPPLPAAVASPVQAPEPVVEVLEESAAKDAAVPEVLPVAEIEKAGEPVENQEPMDNELAIAAVEPVVEVPAVIDEDVVSADADEPIAQTAEHVSEAKEEAIEAPATADILPSPDKTTNETEPAVEEKPAEPAAAPVPVIGGPLPVAAAAEAIAAPVKKKAGCWTVFTTLFFFAALFVLVAVGGAAAYAWSKLGDFEKEITTLATTKLADQGIHLDHGEWTYAFPRGVVFDEVTLFDDETKARPAVKISGLGVNVDFLGLATNPGELGAAEISLADSLVTLYQKGELFSEITGADGEILIGDSEITVERLNAKVGGMRVRLEGVIHLPDKDTNVAPAPAAAPAEGGAAKPSPLAALDFSGFRVLEPWLGFEGTGESAPLLSLSFEMDADEPDLARIEGTLGGSDLKWRGLELKSLSAAFRIDPQTGELRFPNVQIGQGDGLLTGIFAIDMAAQKVRVERLQSTVDPLVILPAFDPTWADSFKSIRFVDAPALQITGEMPLGDAANANLKIRYEHRQGLVYVDGERELPVSDIRGLFTYNRGALETNDTAGNVFGGQLYVNGATNLIRDKNPFTGLIEITGMDLKKAAAWFGEDAAGLAGRLNLTFRGTGNTDITSINGGGQLRIEEATLPAFPAIGPVQEMIGKVVPAFSLKGSGTVTGAYILESGVLVTSDLTVRNGSARLVTNGNVNLASKNTTFVTTADLEPALAAASGLKDKAIQVEGSGPLDGPTLKIRQFPVEFAAAGLGEVLGTTPESLGGLKELIDSGNAAEVISGKIEEATGIQLDPAVTDLLKGLLGEDAAPAAPAPAPIRAVPQ